MMISIIATIQGSHGTKYAAMSTTANIIRSDYINVRSLTTKDNQAFLAVPDFVNNQNHWHYANYFHD